MCRSSCTRHRNYLHRSSDQFPGCVQTSGWCFRRRVGLVRVGLKLTSPAPFGVPFIPISLFQGNCTCSKFTDQVRHIAIVTSTAVRGLSQEIEIQVEGDASTLKSTSSVLSCFSPRKFPLTSLTKSIPYLKLPKPRYSEGSSTQRAHQPSHRSQSQEELSSMDPQKMRSTAEQYANQSIK